MFYRFWRTVLVGLSYLCFGVEIRGREHLPASGVYIVAPSHRSVLDIPLAAAVTRRRLRFMAKQEIFRGPVWTWIFGALGAVPVDRAGNDRAALKAVEGALHEGEPIVIFPEGTRRSGPVLGPLASGTAYVALKAGVPVVPVGIGGSETVVVRSRGVPWFSRVTVVIGPPITVERVGGTVKRSAITDLDAALRARLQAVFDEAQAASARRSAGRRASHQAGQGV
jgi:1-acyl-sn-glycerol-3-phosphate acyltransferase